MTSASRSKGEDVAAIAASFKQQQREDVLAAPCPLQDKSLADAWIYADLGMIDCQGWTPLGIAVRAHLTDQEGQNR